MTQPTYKCSHCKREVKPVNQQWHDLDGGAVPQYCWVDPVDGSQLHSGYPQQEEVVVNIKASP